MCVCVYVCVYRRNRPDAAYKPYSMHRDTTDGNLYEPVYRWRQAIQNDFRARMDRSIFAYNQVNHAPMAAIGGDLSIAVVFISANRGSNVQLDASASKDPDNDALSYDWDQYQDAGTFDGPVSISGATTAKATVRMPSSSAGSTVHIILSVSDNGVPSLTSYRRVIITIT